MIKRIRHQEKTVAIVFKKKDDTEIKEGLNFLTNPENSFQVGVIAHPRGHVILPHSHKKTEKFVCDRQEMLYVESGKMKVDFLTESGEKIEDEILEPGDFVLLIDGGHGMEILEDNTKVVYVKQGPHISKDADKIVFGELK